MSSIRSARVFSPARAIAIFLCGLLPALADPRADQAMGFLERLRANGAPGVSAAVAVHGEIVFSGGVGFAEIENGTPERGTTVHNVGSISKTIAVIAVMQLWEQGKVDLDSEIQTYVPWFPRKPQPVTVRQILTHTSGIGKIPIGPTDFYASLSTREYASFEDSTRSWRDDPLLFVPGTHWHYSQAVNLIQGLVESVAGVPLEEYLRRHVWEPAGMVGTQFDVPTRIVPHRGRGYWRSPRNDRLENYPAENLNGNYVGGGMISTDEDLCRLGSALNAGRLLKPASCAEMYRRQLAPDISLPDAEAAALKDELAGKPPFRPGDFQALLWVVGRDVEGRAYVGHTGGARGTSSWWLIYPEQDVVVAIHMNFHRMAVDLQPAEALAQIFLPKPASRK